MQYSVHTSRTIASVLCLAAVIPLTSAAPTPSYTSSEPIHPRTHEPPLDTVRRSNRDSLLIQRDVEVHVADNVGNLASTSAAHIVRYAIMTQPTPPPIASPTGGLLLESIGSGSNPLTPSVMVDEACVTAVRLSTELEYHIAVLVLLSCTFIAAAFTAFHSVYRQWHYNRLRNRNFPSVNLYSPPSTPKPKPRLSISLPDCENGALKRKGSASTLCSISEEPSTPARKSSFAASPRDSSRPPSYTVGPISLLDSPAHACFTMSPSSSSSQRTLAEGQSSFLP